MTDRQQQIIFYALIKSLEKCDVMMEEIFNEIQDNVKWFDYGTLFSIGYNVKHKDFKCEEDKELAVRLLAAINRELEARDEE